MELIIKYIKDIKVKKFMFKKWRIEVKKITFKKR
jgi:hypothetical protein